MASLKEKILRELAATPGLTDRELTDRILGQGARPQSVNQATRSLAEIGDLHRRKRADGITGNYLESPAWTAADDSRPPSTDEKAAQSEDDIKRALHDWLTAAGWQVKVAWGRERGIDIEAVRGNERWVIEVKGSGSLDAMRVNYFLMMLGELLQRMSDSDARYSIALPDLKQFRGLWHRLPRLAKARTGITALFVTASGEVREERT